MAVYDVFPAFYAKYARLRPAERENGRFVLQFPGGRCIMLPERDGGEPGGVSRFS